MDLRAAFYRLTNTLGDQRAVIKPLASQRIFAGLEEFEVPDVATPDNQPDDSASWTVFITYSDAKGAESKRVITFRRIAGRFGDPEWISAHCHLRHKLRRFKIEQITGMACAQSGEVLDPLENCIALQRSGALQIEDLPLTRLMRVLTFFARCDGQFHDCEREVIEDLVGGYFRRFRRDEIGYECAVSQGMRLAPSAEDFIKALKWIAKDPSAGPLARFALESSAAVIAADGVQRPEEFHWGAEASAILKNVASRH